MSELSFEIAERDTGERLELPAVLPVLPLKDTVVFPQSMAPLAIGQERSVRLIDDVVAGDRLLALVTRAGPVDRGARLGRHLRRRHGRDRPQDDQGPRRDAAHPRRRASQRVHLDARAPTTSRTCVGELRGAARRARRHARGRGADAQRAGPVRAHHRPRAVPAGGAAARRGERRRPERALPPRRLDAADDPDRGAPAASSRRSTSRQRLRTVTAILNRELEVFELGSKIQSQVQSEMEKGQREYFLRQQLKAIQAELGEGDPEQAEVDELRERLEALDAPRGRDARPPSASSQRLERLPPAAAEYGVIRTYLEWILTLPWDTLTEDNLDLEHAREVLDDDHFDLDKVKERIVEYLAVAKLRNEISGQILCFVGPAGRRQDLARPVDRAGARAASSCASRSAASATSRRSAATGAPTSARCPARSSARCATPSRANPLLLIDEIDKMGADWRGDPASAMLEVLDPEQNGDVPRPLPRPAVRPVEGAVHLHREHARHDPRAAARPDGRDPALGLHRGREARDREALPRCRSSSAAHGLKRSQLRSPTRVLRHDHPRVHARGGRAQPRAADRRRLPQGGDAGRAGREAQDQGRRRSAARVARPAPLLRARCASARPHPGVATGLAYTAVGGDVLFIEATAYPGKGS